MSQLNEVFLAELADIYYAEGQILKALPKLVKAAESPDLKQAFMHHVTQTEAQIERVKKVFEMLGKPPRGKKCKGILGILEENKEMMTELDEGPGLDAALIAGAQKVEHYEIATYGALRTWAGMMNNHDAQRLLQETLEEEEMTDRKLTELAEQHTNREAMAA